MDLRELRLFLAVVDGGGMTRAAEAEHVSQPSVSQAIRELETELGTPLFHRVGPARGAHRRRRGARRAGPPGAARRRDRASRGRGGRRAERRTARPRRAPHPRRRSGGAAGGRVPRRAPRASTSPSPTRPTRPRSSTWSRAASASSASPPSPSPIPDLTQPRARAAGPARSPPTRDERGAHHGGRHLGPLPAGHRAAGHDHPHPARGGVRRRRRRPAHRRGHGPTRGDPAARARRRRCHALPPPAGRAGGHARCCRRVAAPAPRPDRCISSTASDRSPPRPAPSASSALHCSGPDQLSGQSAVAAGCVGSPAAFHAEKPPTTSVAPVQSEVLQAGGGEAGRVPLGAEQDHLDVVIDRLGDPRVARGIEPPFEVVALDHQRAGDLALVAALPPGPCVDQQRAARRRRAAASVRGDALGAAARAGGEEIVDAPGHSRIIAVRPARSERPARARSASAPATHHRRSRSPSSPAAASTRGRSWPVRRRGSRLGARGPGRTHAVPATRCCSWRNTPSRRVAVSSSSPSTT